jgi:hypothetical protein
LWVDDECSYGWVLSEHHGQPGAGGADDLFFVWSFYTEQT